MTNQIYFTWSDLFQIFDRSYKNHVISNVYNFLSRTYFKNLISNLIKLIIKNKVTDLFLLNFIFLKFWKIFKYYNFIVEYKLPAPYNQNWIVKLLIWQFDNLIIAVTNLAKYHCLQINFQVYFTSSLSNNYVNTNYW